MEIFKLENTKCSVICPECKNILKFKINSDKFVVEGECRNGHNNNNIPFNSFIMDYIKNTSSTKLIKCYKCFTNNQSTRYLCQACNELFCFKCVNEHLKEKGHINIKIISKNNKLCQKHNKIFFYYCYNCSCYICESCKIDHHGHFINSFLDIFPNKEKKNLIREKASIFEEKIKQLKENVFKIKKVINEKIEKLDNYFKFLLEINNKLFKKYNYSIFDYHNYENLNYIYNFIKNEKIFEEKVYLDYIIFGHNLNIINKQEEGKENNDEKKELKINNNNAGNFLIKDYSKINYLKDNIFYELEINNTFFENYIKLYEFSDFNFTHITTYNFNNFTKILFIKPSKYGNYFLINFRLKKNIKFLEFDYNKKEFILSKNEIKSSKTELFDKHFNDLIDCKNGNIITADEEGLKLWEKSNKKKFFNMKFSFPKNYYKLYNINDKIFMAKCYDLITFFNFSNIEPIKSLNLYGIIDFVSSINNKLLIIKNEKKYVLISIKYFDICQIFDSNENIYPLKAIDNALIQYNINDINIKLIINKYNEEKGYFNEEKVIILNHNLSQYSKLLMTDNKELFIGNNGTINLFTKII